MFKFFRNSRTKSLQKKYDELMREAYFLSREHPEASKKKQEQAQQVQKELIAQRAA